MNTDAIESLNRDLSRAVKEEREATDEFNRLSMEIDDIENSRALYDNLLKKQAIISHLCDATSPSKGIPLIFVKVFLNDCVDIINELISMVFDDTIVIKEFHITEKEFLIPYYKNGREIHDVKSASQGEKAIISLALSFALMRKGILDKHIGNGYNILLLDEIDGALYSEDRQKFLMILAQQMKAINAEQVFLITHNNSFDGYPVNIIMTTPETIDNKETPVLYV
jgi:DNA repair exonuclease SbcCD ATPase subunit